MDHQKNRPFRLRNKTIEELRNGVEELKKELSTLRINKITSGVASKLSKLKVVRKAIARHLTVINQKKRQELKDAMSSRAGIKKYNKDNNTNFSVNRIPKELRPRKTRALRRKLTKHQASKVLPKIKKRINAFPQRSFALRA